MVLYFVTPAPPADTSQPKQPPTTKLEVRYTVKGKATKADLTLENQLGGTEQKKDVPLPYELNFQATPGQFLYISAQNTTDSTHTSITCEIRVNGVVTEKSVSDGQYSIATCSGSAESTTQR